jgi:hypothetical protein
VRDATGETLPVTTGLSLAADPPSCTRRWRPESRSHSSTCTLPSDVLIAHALVCVRASQALAVTPPANEALSPPAPPASELGQCHTRLRVSDGSEPPPPPPPPPLLLLLPMVTCGISCSASIV